MLSEIVYAFEAAHQGGEVPRVEEFVPAEGAARIRAAAELVRIDLEYRSRRGLTIRVDDYLKPIPELARDEELLLEMIEAECRQRRAGGEPAEAKGYAGRFPALAGRLAARLEGSTKALSRGGTEPRFTSAEWPPVPGYEMLAELGRGGMGVVFKARQIGLGREVALKMLLGGAIARPAEMERFRLEAQAIARLKDPHIVTIHDVGQCGGQPYFSMELMKGSLADRLQAGPLPHGKAAGLVENLARTMHEVHLCGFLHRDLKPGNVLLTSDDTPKIADFGLAKRLDQADTLAASGAIVGTAAYMAPEQAAGSSRARILGPAADVYALGAILYEVLTGRPPFQAASWPETLELVKHQEPAPPSRLEAGIPRDLETICLKCLAKDPGRRYADALELAEDLRRFQNHEPIVARPVGRVERLLLWARRRPMQAAVGGLAGLVLVLGILGGAAAWLWQEAEQARQETGEARDRLAGEKRLTEKALWGEKQAKQAKEQAFQNEVKAKNKLAEVLYYQDVLLALLQWRENKVALADQRLQECEKARRDWEWGYVHHLCHAERLSLNDHQGEVWSACYSPDGTRLASASADGMVRVWDAATGQEIGRPQKHAGPVTSICFNPEGDRLASGSSAGTIRVWEGETGKEPFVLQERHFGRINRVCFSPDGQRLASASEDKTGMVWDAQTGKMLFRITNGTAAVKGVCFSPDSTRLASTADGPTVKMWDATTGKRLSRLDSNAAGLNGYFTCVCFGPDGKAVASGLSDKLVNSVPTEFTIKIWDADKGEEIATLRGPTGEVNGVCFSGDGRRLASAANDMTVKVWDVARGQEVVTFKGHRAAVNSVSFRRGGKWLASASSDRTVKIWDAAGNQEVLTLERHYSPVHSVCFSPDGKRMASAGADNRVTIWDAATGGNVRHRFLTAGALNGVCFSPDSQWLAVACRDHTVKVFGARDLRLLFTLAGHKGAVTSVAFRQGGKWLASASEDKTVNVWDLDQRRLKHTLEGHQAAVTCVCFHPDGKWLASASADRTVKLWDLDHLRAKRTFEGHAGPVQGVCFSPDGHRLASASSDQTVKIWEAETGQEVRTFRGHSAAVRSVCFNPKGTRLATGSDDHTVVVWDAATGQMVLTFKEHTKEVSSVAFSPDGGRLASASFDATIKMWEATPVGKR
jgi:WD40 repeat protein